jgi:hypothetical protein
VLREVRMMLAHVNRIATHGQMAVCIQPVAAVVTSTQATVEQVRSATDEALSVPRKVFCHAGSRPTEHVLGTPGEPPIGAHIVTPRLGYTHHGIYVGEGRVVQYGGLSLALRRGPVEEVSLAQFARGREIRFRLEESGLFDREEIICRARLRLGENRYHPLTNNCEHFCEWCVRGESRSYQVDALITRSSRLWQSLLKVLYRALSRHQETYSASCG